MKFKFQSYYPAFCYVCIGDRDKAIDELKECIPDDIYKRFLPEIQMLVAIHKESLKILTGISN